MMIPTLTPYKEALQNQKIEACNLLRILHREDTITAHRRLASLASFVLVVGEKTVATGSFDFVDDDTIELDNIAVDRTKRRRGYGTFLVRSLENTAFDTTRQDLTVNVNSTVEGESFYLSLGYRPNGSVLGTFTKTITSGDVYD